MWSVDCGLWTAYLDGEWFVWTVEGRVLAVRECASKLAEIVVGTNFRRCFFRCFVLLLLFGFFGFFVGC